MKFKLAFCILLLLASARHLMAEEVYLKNGDRITGKIVEETETTMVIETEAMGRIHLDRKHIQNEMEQISSDIQKKNDVQWKRSISFGYSQTGGNTEASEGSGKLFINRKTGHDEWTGKLSTYISTSNDELDAKKFYGMGRYAFSFGESLKWYNFYKLESDQDRFANIDYRLIPSVGVGYWFSDKEEWKVMIEGAIGFEYTNYHDGTKSEGGAVLIPRGFFEKKLLGDLKISENIILYPSLSESGEYRLRSETVLTDPITDKAALKVSFIDDFNSDPSGSTKKNDFRLISSIDYTF